MVVYSLINIFTISLFIFAGLIGALFFVFWIMMLIDSITRKFKEGNEKIIWVLVNIFVGIIGALIYYFIVYKKDKSRSMKWFWWTILTLVILFILFFVIILMINPTMWAGNTW